MRIISVKKLKEFWLQPRCNDSEQALKTWCKEIKNNNWQTSNDIKKKFKTASIIGNNRIVFNIKGNKYRLVVTIKYKFQLTYIRFIGTHDEYDKINVKII